MFFSAKKKAKQKKTAVAKTKKKSEPAQKKAGEEPKATQAAKVSDAVIREKLRAGWVRAIIVFELVGKPREHIEQTLQAYVASIKSDGRVLSLNEEFADALEHEDGMFSAFVEMEALVQDVEALTWLAINFMPASIEVVEPEQLALGARDITNWYNDLLAKLHETSNILREERGVNSHLTEALNALIKNAIIACLRGGDKNKEELEAMTGIAHAQLAPFLEHLVAKGKLLQKGTQYALP